MRNDSSDASCVVVIGREILIVLFPGLSFTFALFHEFLDQFDIVLEAIVLCDE